MSQTTTAQVNVTVPDHLNPATSKGYQMGERGAHNIATGYPHPYPLPKFESKEEERKWVKNHMAGAFRVFARKDFTEGAAGHISVRDPIDPETFWINPLAVHFGMIKASDLVHVDKDGKVLPDGNQWAVNTAGFAIHSQLHQARPDIHAACHTHSVHGRAYSALGKPLEMINQDACMFFKSHAVYSDFGGVALEANEGRAIAEAIGSGNSAILQNHGLLTVGTTVDEAAYLFTLMERTCQAQLLADAAANEGNPKKVISDDAAGYTYHQVADPESLYAEFQPDFNYEIALSGGDFLDA